MLKNINHQVPIIPAGIRKHGAPGTSDALTVVCQWSGERPNNLTQSLIIPLPKFETHHKVGLGETPRRLIRERCRYS